MPKNDFLWTTDAGAWPEIWVARWTDPCSDIQKVWMSPDDVRKTNPLDCMAAGFLVEKNKDSVKLASSVCANGQSGQVITIPMKSLTVLGKVAGVGKPAKKAKKR